MTDTSSTPVPVPISKLPLAMPALTDYLPVIVWHPDLLGPGVGGWVTSRTPVSSVGPPAPFGEAPQDGSIYGRQSGHWTVVPGGGLGTGNVVSSGTPVSGQLATWTGPFSIAGVTLSSLGLAPLVSPGFLGDPRAPTPAIGDNDTSIATTAFVTTAVAAAVPTAPASPVASPTFTGVPKAPTPLPADSSTQLATTAFVKGAIAAIPQLTVNIRIFSANTSYVPTTGTSYIIVEAVGGGGGGGGVIGSGSFIYVGGGGGGGSYSRKFLSAATVGASQPIVVGTGGAGGPAGGATPGGDGGDTSFGTFCVAHGGKGGAGYNGSGAGQLTGFGGAAGTGDVTATGASGDKSNWSSSDPVGTAFGGNSVLGGGGGQVLPTLGGTSPGLAGGNYGAGGGGGIQFDSTVGGSAGGHGSDGVVIVTEFSGVVGSGGGGIPEAPIDGKIYGRNNATWTPIIQGGSTGTVNSGVAGQLAIYPATGTTVGPATAAQATAVLNVFTPTLAGLVPFSGGGPLNFLRADGIWTVPPGGGSGGGGGSGVVSAGTANQIAFYSVDGTVVQGETLLQALNMPAFTGDVTSPSGSLVNTIAPAAVTNAKLANMPATSFKGNPAGAASVPQDIPASTVTSMLSIFSSSAQGVVPLSGGGTTNFLRADGAWIAPPSGGGGGGTPPGGAVGSVQYNNSGAFGGYTNSQLTSLIQPFSSAASGAAPASGGGSLTFLRADGTWAVPTPGGTPGGATSNVQFNSSGVLSGNAGFIYSGAGTIGLGGPTFGNGSVQLKGATSGFASLAAPATGANWILTLPNSGGTTGFVLQTNGSGVTSWVAQAPGNLALATSDVTYHVTAVGNDTTADGSVASPFATIQRAFEIGARTFNFGGFQFIIQVGPGTFQGLDVDTSLVDCNAFVLIGDNSVAAGIPSPVILTTNPRITNACTITTGKATGGVAQSVWVSGFTFTGNNNGAIDASATVFLGEPSGLQPSKNYFKPSIAIPGPIATILVNAVIDFGNGISTLDVSLFNTFSAFLTTIINETIYQSRLYLDNWQIVGGALTVGRGFVWHGAGTQFEVDATAGIVGTVIGPKCRVEAGSFLTVQGVNLLPGTLPPAVTSGGLVYDFTNLQTITGGNPAGAYTIYGASVNIGQQGTNTGQLKLLGTTSGQVTLSTQDAAGTWTLKLPATTGTVSQVLQTDGAGNTSWVTPAGGVGSTPGGATTNVQYNNAGSFGGAAGFTYNGVATVGLGAVGAGTGVVQLKGTTSGVVSLTTATAAGTWTMQLPTTAGSANQFLQTNGSGVCTWATGGGGPGTPAGSVQFNSVSAFAGSADFLWTTGTGLTVGGATLAGSVITAGAGEHQAIGTHAVIDTDVFAPGDPVHMSVQPGKPLVLNLVQYYAGDLSVGHSRNNIATGVGLKHTGAAKAFTYNYSGGAVVTSDSTGPWSAFGEMHLAPVNYGSGLVDYMVGALIEVENEGTATTMYAIDLAAQQGSGTVGTVAAIHISPSFGTVTNCYGMLIDDFATSHGTNKFPIYVKGGAQTCAIEGALSLGLAATNTGKLKLAGTTSGVVTLQSQDVAGTWTMQLPTTAGSANQVLQTNGSGVCTWATAGAGGVNAGTINQLAYYAAAGSVVSGETVLQAVNMPALVGDVTTPGGSLSATIAAGVVTNAKLATMAASSFKGNTTGATAAPTDMTVANAWTLLGVEPAANSPAFTGDVTKPSGSLAQTIAASVVTNAKMANMVTATIKGNNSGSTGAPLDLTTTQVTAMLNNFTTALAGLAPASGGGTTNFLRADGTWTAPAGGGVNAGTINQLAYYAAAGSTVSGETLLQAANHPALTGDVTCTAGTVATVIAANAVNNPKLAQAIANSFKGNPTGALANVTDMTGTAATALLNIFTTALQGLVPASGGGTTNFLRADGTWNTPGIPINNQSVAYTAVLADANTAITHPTTDNTARTFTIPANSSVAYPIGTTLTFVNMINTLTIAITTDTMTLAGPGTTGSRTLAANGIATALKLTSTTWLISGTGLT